MEKGRFADLVLLDANSLTDIGNTQKIAAAVSNGRYFSQAELGKLLGKVEEEAKSGKAPVTQERGAVF